MQKDLFIFKRVGASGPRDGQGGSGAGSSSPPPILVPVNAPGNIGGVAGPTIAAAAAPRKKRAKSKRVCCLDEEDQKNCPLLAKFLTSGIAFYSIAVLIISMASLIMKGYLNLQVCLNGGYVIKHFEGWRVIFASWVHSSWPGLFANLSFFILFGFWFERKTGTKTALISIPVLMILNNLLTMGLQIAIYLSSVNLPGIDFCASGLSSINCTLAAYMMLTYFFPCKKRETASGEEGEADDTDESEESTCGEGWAKYKKPLVFILAVLGLILYVWLIPDVVFIYDFMGLITGSIMSLCMKWHRCNRWLTNDEVEETRRN